LAALGCCQRHGTRGEIRDQHGHECGARGKDNEGIGEKQDRELENPTRAVALIIGASAGPAESAVPAL